MTSGPPGSERPLARPPSDRYRQVLEDERPTPAGSLRDAVLAAGAGALVTAVLAVLLGGALAVSAGLLVLWVSGGYVIGVATRIRAGNRVPLARRRLVAAVAALVGVALAQLGLWGYASSEGGVLPLVDYLAQTFGLLVPLQAILAPVAAWWSAR